MLERILEPEVMDGPREAAEYDAMDHREVNRQFVSDFLSAIDNVASPRGQALHQTPGKIVDRIPVEISDEILDEILDLGTGSALIPIELCRRDRQARVWGVDLAESMLQLGQRNVNAAGFAEQIVLQHVDAKALPFPNNRFAAVMSNSIVHHIPQPLAVLSEAVRVLAPGGTIFFRDLLRPADEATLQVLVDTHAAGSNANQRHLFEDSLRAALSLREIQDLVTALGLAASSVQP